MIRMAIYLTNQTKPNKTEQNKTKQNKKTQQKQSLIQNEPFQIAFHSFRSY